MMLDRLASSFNNLYTVHNELNKKPLSLVHCHLNNYIIYLLKNNSPIQKTYQNNGSMKINDLKTITQ